MFEENIIISRRRGVGWSVVPHHTTATVPLLKAKGYRYQRPIGDLYPSLSSFIQMIGHALPLMLGSFIVRVNLYITFFSFFFLGLYTGYCCVQCIYVDKARVLII